MKRFSLNSKSVVPSDVEAGTLQVVSWLPPTTGNTRGSRQGRRKEEEISFFPVSWLFLTVLAQERAFIPTAAFGFGTQLFRISFISPLEVPAFLL